MFMNFHYLIKIGETEPFSRKRNSTVPDKTEPGMSRGMLGLKGPQEAKAMTILSSET